MYKLTNRCVSGTSFHDTTIMVKPSQLLEVFGEPQFEDADDKSQMEWNFEDNEGNVFTLYDWKEDCNVRAANFEIEFHIGSKSSRYAEDCFKDWLKNSLK